MKDCITVKQLIEVLSKYPEGHRVVISGYEGGFEDVAIISPIELDLNVHEEWWFGKHEAAEKGAKGVPAVLIMGKGRD